MSPFPRIDAKTEERERAFAEGHSNYLNYITMTQTHHCLLHIDLLPPGQAKVSNLGSQILSHQDIPGSQVSVNKLEEIQQRETMAVVEAEVFCLWL